MDLIAKINSDYAIYLEHHHNIYANEQPNKEQELQIISFIRNYEKQLIKPQESHLHYGSRRLVSLNDSSTSDPGRYG